MRLLVVEKGLSKERVFESKQLGLPQMRERRQFTVLGYREGCLSKSDAVDDREEKPTNEPKSAVRAGFVKEPYVGCFALR